MPAVMASPARRLYRAAFVGAGRAETGTRMMRGIKTRVDRQDTPRSGAARSVAHLLLQMLAAFLRVQR